MLAGNHSRRRGRSTTSFIPSFLIHLRDDCLFAQLCNKVYARNTITMLETGIVRRRGDSDAIPPVGRGENVVEKIKYKDMRDACCSAETLARQTPSEDVRFLLEPKVFVRT